MRMESSRRPRSRRPRQTVQRDITRSRSKSA